MGWWLSSYTDCVNRVTQKYKSKIKFKYLKQPLTKSCLRYHFGCRCLVQRSTFNVQLVDDLSSSEIIM